MDPQSPWKLKGEMADLFGNDNPIQVGSGKGALFQVWPSKTLTSTISGLIFKVGFELRFGQGA